MRRMFALIIALLAFPALAQQAKPFKVAQGSVTGTYGEAFKELANACSTESLPLIPAFPDGKGDGAGNLESLANNTAQAAFVRNDVIFWQGQGGQLTNIKTLFTLWPETVHLVALAQSKTLDQGGVLGFGKKPVQFNTIRDLAGRRLGAVGANQITANVIRAQTGINFETVPMTDGKTALAKLTAGEVDAVIFTAGKPLPILQGLDANYKLLAIPPDVAKQVSAVYRPTTITYSNLAQAFNVPTVEADSIFVTKVFSTDAKRSQLAELRRCFLTRLAELKDEGSARWQSVDENNHGKWPWYELPAQAAQRPTRK
jgi:TRAP-type uncharacterized transport system substrate-binding protein